MSQINPFKYYKTSPEIIKLAVMYYIRYPLSLRQVEDILHELGIDVCHETVRYWWNKFGALFSKEVKKQESSAKSVEKADVTAWKAKRNCDGYSSIILIINVI